MMEDEVVEPVGAIRRPRTRDLEAEVAHGCDDLHFVNFWSLRAQGPWPCSSEGSKRASLAPGGIFPAGACVPAGGLLEPGAWGGC